MKYTPKDLFLMGALRRSHAECFYQQWLVPVELDLDFCKNHAEKFDWYVLSLTFLDKEEFTEFKEVSLAKANETFFKARAESDPIKYRSIWASCQNDLAESFFNLHIRSKNKPFYKKFWNWITS